MRICVLIRALEQRAKFLCHLFSGLRQIIIIIIIIGRRRLCVRAAQQ